MELSRIRVGCSGWQYTHWRGDFYPAELPTSRWPINVERLEHFLRVITEVAADLTAYAKATAVRRSVARRRKVGPYRRPHQAIEFREPSWYDERVFALLRKFNNDTRPRAARRGRPSRADPRARRTCRRANRDSHDIVGLMALADSISGWLRERVQAAGVQGLVFGLSGGVDSAVVGRVCQLAMPDACVGVIMPCHSHPQDAADARLVADHFRIPVLRVPLEEPFDALTRLADAAFDMTPGLRPHATDDIRARVPRANVKPRLRMTTLYLVANRLNYLVAGTGNLSEIAIGYYTKYGDGGVDLLPIGRLLKREVLELARALGVPARVIEKPPTAGLWLGQTDESEMDFTYAELEQFITGGPSAVPPDTARRIEHLIAVSEHKRAMPPTPPG